MPPATSSDIRDIFLAHLDRLRADYSQRANDCKAAASAAADQADGWTCGLERGLAMAYETAAADLNEAIKVERGLFRVVVIPGGQS